jgi:hypothetical protein
MKKLLFVWVLLLSVAAQAQDMSYGVSSRFGVYKTLVSSSEQVGYNNQYGPGMQLELGTWLRWHVTEKHGVQLALSHGIERQYAGTLKAVDQQGNDITDVKTRYGSLSVSATALYLYQYNDRLAVGVGVAGKYRYVNIMVMQELEYRLGPPVGGKEYYENMYHRKIVVYVPLEAQVRLRERLHLVSQVQVPLSNKVAARESAFKERDLGLSVGVNYTL